MAKSKLDKGLSGIDKIFIEDPRRAIVIGVAILVVIVLLVVFWNKIKGLFEAITNKGALNSELQEHMQETGESPTLSNAVFNLLANKLYTAMKGIGTDENTIYGVFNQMNNTADLYKLVAVFGTRDGETLDQWIRGDMSNREIKKINQILTNKGIAYSF